MSANGCWCLPVSPLLASLPYGNWERLQPSHDPELDQQKEIDGWLVVLLYYCYYYKYYLCFCLNLTVHSFPARLGKECRNSWETWSCEKQSGMTRWLFSFLLYKILVNIIHCQLLRFYFCNTFSAAQVLYNHQTARYTIFVSVFVSMTMRIWRQILHAVD